MCARNCIRLFSICSLMIVVSGVGAATPITVVNYSFELPGTVKQHCWDGERPALEGSVLVSRDVPGWTDGAASSNDSGTETGYTTAADGSWTGFMMGSDPNVYNLTNFLIGSGDVFKLEVNARNNYASTTFKISLFYDNNGTRVPLASYNRAVTSDLLTNPSTLFSLTFSTDTVPACYDHQIGIEFDNTTTASASWIGFDNVQLTLTSPLMRAENPYPANKGTYEGTNVTLAWTAGPDATSVDSYKVYFSDNRADVNSGAAYKSLTNTTSYLISSLVQGRTYYWRIDTVSGANTYRGNIWSFSTVPSVAYNPSPSTGTSYVPVDKVLSWEAGTGAVKGHVVFFGTSLADVNNAPVGTSGTAPFRAYLTNPADVNWAPSESGLAPLKTSTTYYWRIDEVESTSPQKIYKGNVWSFTTVPVVGLGSITREVWENITGSTVADLTGNPNYPNKPSFTDHLPLFDTPRDWADNYGTLVRGWLYIETTGDYTFWLCADDAGELWLGNNMIASNSTATGYHQWDNCPQSTPIHLEAGNLYYIMGLQKEGTGRDILGVAWSLSADDNTAQIIPGTSLVPFEMYEMVWAHDPKPANGAADMRIDPNLNWTSGAHAAKHDVYFGTNFDDVNNASKGNDPHHALASQNQLANTYNPRTLQFETTYYWRIDEVNDAHPDKLWKGSVWSFAVGSYLIIDNFEDYNNFTPDRVFQTWLDGVGYSADQYFPVAYNGNGTGAAVGHDIWTPGTTYTNIMETMIVHSGTQSMPLDYNNTKTPYYSETTRIFATSQDWTNSGVKALTLWFRGLRDSVGSLHYDSATGTYTIAGSGTDIWGTADQFYFAYKTFTGDGSIIARIDSLENTNASAKVGVMMRENLDAGSALADVVITADGRVALQYRTSAGADMGSPDSSTQTVANAITLPHWVKLTRQGSVFTAQHSADGANWVDITPETAGELSHTSFAMGQTVYIGLAITARNATAVCHAKISNVTINGSSTSPFTTPQDIGIVSNDAAPLYITLEDDSTGKKTVSHTINPNAVLQNTWQEWNISLSDFTGVKLDKIKKMTIGIGDKIQGGAGSLYFDDIRLYRPRCVPTLAKSAANFSGDCLVGYADLDVMANAWLLADGFIATTPDDTAGLVGYWTLDGNANDSSGNANHGLVNGSPTWVTAGQTGGALAFDGVNDYVQVNRTVQDDFTLAAWIKTDRRAQAGTRAYQGSGLIWSDVSGDSNDFILAVVDTKLAFAVASADIISNLDVVTGQWVHVAATRKASSGEIVVFVNGKVDVNETTTNTRSLTANPLIIIGADTLDGRYYAGLIDDVRMYNRVLSNAEIAYLADTTPGDGQLYVQVRSPAELYSPESAGSRKVNFKDFAVLAATWLEEKLWP